MANEFDSAFIPSNNQKTEVQKFLEEIRSIFRDSPLLKGNTPPDQLIQGLLTPAMKQNLKELKKEDPDILNKAEKAIQEERNNAKKPGKK